MSPDEPEYLGPAEDPAIEGLRALWQRESDATPELPAESLAATDSRTQAVVHWLQAAWTEEAQRELAPELPDWITPRSSAPKWFHPARSRRTRFAHGSAALAAAALAAAALLLALLAPWKIEPAQAPTTTLVGDVEPALEPASPIYGEGRFVSRGDGIELVTGHVRVVLLQPQR